MTSRLADLARRPGTAISWRRIVAVVAVAGEQLALPVRDGFGVQAPDPAHDQPGADVVGFAVGT